jgi:predicted nucleic acid-binding protein
MVWPPRLFLRTVLDLPIVIDIDAAPAAILAVACRSNLSAYDASYIELAARLSVPLATTDRQLRSAARKSGVALALMP